MPVRFHLDENLSPAIAEGLRMHGVDVSATEDVGLISAPDLDHIDFALRTDRVIVTQDRDFLILAHSGVPHAGIVFSAAGKLSIGEYVRRLLLYHQCYEQDDLRGRVEYL